MDTIGISNEVMATLSVGAGSIFAVLGAVVGTHWFIVAREKRHVNGVLLAIHAEVTILWKTYMAMIGNKLACLQKGSEFTIIWPVNLNANYFVIYENNAEFIGKIEDAGLRKEIVNVYILTKALMDSYCYNNTLIQEWVNEHRLYEGAKLIGGAKSPTSLMHETNIESYRLELVEYVGRLRELHNELEVKISELLNNIKKYLA